MITLLTGENSFELDRELKRIIAGFDGEVERIDGSELEPSALADLLTGLSLFATKRLIVIKHLSDNKVIWPVFDEWLERVSDDVHLVLVEPKPDKRTRTYKALQKQASLQEFKLWGERDTGVAEKWAIAEAKQMELVLDTKLVRLLVQRTGVDQWRLYHALEKLAALGTVNEQIIDEIVEPNATENVFQLFETALKGDSKKVHAMITTLRQSTEAQPTLGLLNSQALQLVALAASDQPSEAVARDIGAHPFVMKKLAPYARKRGLKGAKEIIEVLAQADVDMKSLGADPWLLVERALLKIAQS